MEPVTDQHLHRLRMDGWTVIEGVIPKAHLKGLRQSVVATASERGTPEAQAKGIGHVPGFFRYDQSLAPYVSAPAIMELVLACFGPHARVSFATATVNYPGNDRGGWHADWPFNQRSPGHVPAPYPDVIMHLTTLWMLSSFTSENGGTLVVPGSHRCQNNPSGNNGVDPLEPYPTEMSVTGSAGSLLVMDSRLWHTTAPNRSEEARVSVVIRYAPWWLNTEILMPGSAQRSMMVDEPGLSGNEQPPIPRDVFERLPDDVRPLFRQWVEG